MATGIDGASGRDLIRTSSGCRAQHMSTGCSPKSDFTVISLSTSFDFFSRNAMSDLGK